MKKHFIIVVVGVLSLLVLVVLLGFYRFNFTHGGDVIPGVNAADPKNMSYVISGETFVLTNGRFLKPSTQGSATQDTVAVFGEPVYGDLSADGIADAAVLLVETKGGSGTFYYAVLAINNASGTYQATNALLLGDRVAPQTVEIHNGKAVYNYAERKAGEPMTTSPSIGKSLFVYYDKATGQIGELVQNFEGEADPSKMTLGMKKWEWVATTMNDGKITTPKKSGVFSITFAKDGSTSMTTDCNSMGGTYQAKGNSLTFGPLIMTQMFCDGSQEQDFAKTIGQISSYLFTSKGELVLEIKMDGGTMIFR